VGHDIDTDKRSDFDVRAFGARSDYVTGLSDDCEADDFRFC